MSEWMGVAGTVIASVFWDRSFWAEAGKLVAQFIGALIVARLAVGWALQRFKTERAWDREVSVMSDMVLALRDQIDASNEVMAFERWGREMDEPRRERTEKLQIAADEKVRQLSATASILLPAVVAERMAKLASDLADLDDPDDMGGWYVQMEEQQKLRRAALDDLLKLGRSRLRVGE